MLRRSGTLSILIGDASAIVGLKEKTATTTGLRTEAFIPFVASMAARGLMVSKPHSAERI